MDVLLTILPVFWPKMVTVGLGYLQSYLAKNKINAEILDLNNLFYNLADEGLKREWLISCNSKLEKGILSIIKNNHPKEFQAVIDKYWSLWGNFLGNFIGETAFNSISTRAGFNLPSSYLREKSFSSGLKYTWNREKRDLLANSVGLGVESLAVAGAFGNAFENPVYNRMLGDTATNLTNVWLTPEKTHISADAGRLKNWQRGLLGGVLAAGSFVYFNKHKDTGLVPVLVANIGASSLFAAIGAKTHGRSVVDSALQGTTSGLLMFAAKDFIADNIDKTGMGILGKLVHSVSISMRDNLFKGTPALSRYELDFGPLLLGVNFDNPKDRFDFALLPDSAFILTLQILQGNRFDLKKTLKTGALVFSGNTHFDAKGTTYTNIIAVNPSYFSDNFVLLHENIHALQYSEVGILGLPLNRWKDKENLPYWIRIDRIAGTGIALFYSMIGHQDQSTSIEEREPRLWVKKAGYSYLDNPTYSAAPLISAGAAGAGFLYTVEKFDITKDFYKTLSTNLLSGVLSVGLNNLGGKFNSKTGTNSWGLTRLQMAGANWTGSTLLRSLYGSTQDEYGLSGFPGALKDNVSHLYFDSASGIQNISKIAEFGGYANFSADKSKFTPLSSCFENYLSSKLHYNAVNNLNDMLFNLEIEVE